MQQVLVSMSGLHVAFGDEHFFQTVVTPSAVEALIDKMLLRLADFMLPQLPILLMDVEAGAILAHRTDASWAMALSRQHRQRLRRDN